MKSLAEYLIERSEKQKRDSVFSVLVHYVPNGLMLSSLCRLLPQHSEEEILLALEQLVEEELVEEKTYVNQKITGRQKTYFKVADYEKYPVRETIVVGGIEFPRMIGSDLVQAEDLNQPIEALSAYAERLEQRFEDLTSDMTRRWWANIITLFGLFISVFALILRASEPLALDATKISAQQLFWLKIAELLPLALILFVFVFLLRLLVRRFF